MSASEVNFADIQGNILRGYAYAHARHFVLAIGDADGAREFVGSLLPGASGSDLEVTTAEEWDEKPGECLNLGVTYDGLKALGAPGDVLQAFPVAFQQGPAARASVDPDFEQTVGLGDVGPSAPEHWVLGGPKTESVHLILSLYTRKVEHRNEVSRLLGASFGAHGLREVCPSLDADALPEGRVHFGYRDGIAQPRVGVGNELFDMQPNVQFGDVLLGGGHTNVYRGNYLGDIPAALGDNAAYGAFRMLAQDVFGFEELLDEWAEAARMDRELVAAKLMGRWRNGMPLTLSPDSPDPQPPVAADRLNEFDYGPGPDHPTFYDDRHGLRCPVGAHIRRLNPRGARVMGMPHSRRITRRAMPYGPEIEPGQPRDDTERGLVGYFMCADLEMQYEFIQRVWANLDLSTNGLRGTREPIIASQPARGGSFTIRTTDARDPIVLSGLPNLVTTRGSVYCLLPGIGGLSHLAGMA
jgi:deferrochelatase/peroxidase EfeB